VLLVVQGVSREGRRAGPVTGCWGGRTPILLSATWLEVIGRKVCGANQLGGSGALREVDGQDERTGGGWCKEGTGEVWRFRGPDIGFQPP